MTRVQDIVSAIDGAAPFRLQESWDNSGLLVGDPRATVRRVVVTLDATSAVIAEARRRRADCLVAHHPMFMASGLKRLVPSEADAGHAIDLVRAGLALVAAHTNYDSAPGGLNDVLVRKLGLVDARPLATAPVGRSYKLVTFTPPYTLDAIERALFSAGAGRIGDYTECAFRVTGTGSFRGGDSTRPVVGERGRRENVEELRIETVVPPDRLGHVVAALRAAHPYEEPAFDVYPLEVPPEGVGLGRVGVLPKAEPVAAFIRRVKRALGAKTVEVIAPATRPVRRLRTIAVLGGGGGSFWPQALAAKADAFLTGEMKHHERLAAAEAGLVSVVAGHWATEHVAVAGLVKILRAALPEVEVVAARSDRDPTSWR